MLPVAVAGAGGLLFIAVLLLLRWMWSSKAVQPVDYEVVAPAQLVHRLCPHHNVVQGFALEQKDSLDEHLDVLTRKLAEKEGRLRLSKSRIRETQNEIENLHAIDQDVRSKYKELMTSLRHDLKSNELECKRLQEQIEWVSRRRAEIHVEVHRGHKMYSEAAAELASNLSDLQRGRVIDKPQVNQPWMTSRSIQQPIPRATPVCSGIMKSSAYSPASEIIHRHTHHHNESDILVHH